MSNRLNTPTRVPLIGDPEVAERAGAALAESRARTEQVRAMGRAFADLGRAVVRFFARLNKSMDEALAMRDLANMSDHMLADIGLKRSDIPALFARGGFDRGLETALRNYVETTASDEPPRRRAA